MNRPFSSTPFPYTALICFLALAVSIPALAFADNGRDLEISLETSGAHVFSAGVEDGGDVAVTTAGVSASWEYFTVSYGLAHYSWENKHKLPLGNGVDAPWHTLHTLGLGAHYDDMFNDTWGYFIGGSVQALFEKEMDDSFSGFAYAGFVYAASEKWMFRLGVAGEIGPLSGGVMPVFGVDYNVGAETGLSASIGVPETFIRYGFTPEAAIRLQGSYDSSTYRLADDSTVSRKGYAEIQGGMAGLYLDFTPLNGFLLSLGPEFHFAREITIFDKDGDKKSASSVDPAAGMAIRLQYCF